jgi:hypothetical protein
LSYCPSGKERSVAFGVNPNFFGGGSYEQQRKSATEKRNPMPTTPKEILFYFSQTKASNTMMVKVGVF